MAGEAHQVAMLHPNVVMLAAFQLANHSQNCDLEGPRLCALLACQAQNRTTMSCKSGDGSHTLSLTCSTVRGDDLEVRNKSLDDNLGDYLVLEVNCTAVTRQKTGGRKKDSERDQ